MQTEKEYIVGKEIAGLRCESVGEYSLPDYNGDVKKILLVKTRAYPQGKFVGDDTLEISGSVGYNVVYLDSENNITHAEFSTDYDAALKINSESYVDSDVNTAVSSYNVRLIGPRKFSVKSILDTGVCMSERKMHTIAGDAFMEYEPEYVGDGADVMSMAFGCSEARAYNEEITELGGAIADEVEVLVCDAVAELEATDLSAGSVGLKGSIRVNMLYRNGNDTPVSVERVLPYSDEVMLEGADEAQDVSARLEILSLGSSVTPTEDGVKLSVSVSAIPRILARRNCRINLVEDAYLKERGVVNEYSDFNYTEHACTESAEEKYEVRQPLAELELVDVREILCPGASARVDGYEIHDNSLKIRGEIKFSGIACQVSDDNEIVYAPVKFSAPFEQNVNITCQIHDNMRINCHVDALDARVESDGGHLVATCMLSASVTVSSDRRKRCLGASYITDEEYSHDDSVVTVYYPDASENLFEIAKKFHTSVRAIAQSNRLTEAVFAASSSSLGSLGVTKLIVK